VLGSEGKGVRPGVLKKCDETVAIPMRGKIASLNVSAAAAIGLFEVVRQRTA
jgi:23S rRNA (guanosine2251-2'-O)-methyltransferase